MQVGAGGSLLFNQGKFRVDKLPGWPNSAGDYGKSDRAHPEPVEETFTA